MRSRRDAFAHPDRQSRVHGDIQNDTRASVALHMAHSGRRSRLASVSRVDQRLALWKFDTAKWPDLQGVENACVRSWLAAVDDFRNWLILEAV
jgi:hypothetical protein